MFIFFQIAQNYNQYLEEMWKIENREHSIGREGGGQYWVLYTYPSAAVQMYQYLELL